MNNEEISQFTSDYQEIATILIIDCDWSWIQKKLPWPFSIGPLNPTIRGQLGDYQMFLLCKIVARDIQRQPGNTHFILSATKEIDTMWRRHLLNPASYAATCHALAEALTMTATNKRCREDKTSNILFKELIDYEQWSDTDELDEGRRTRIERLKTLARLIRPNFKFSEEEHEFTIIVKKMLNETVSVKVKESWTVADFMVEFQRVGSVTADIQRWILEGKILKEDRLLRDYGLKEGSVLHLVMRLRGC